MLPRVDDDACGVSGFRGECADRNADLLAERRVDAAARFHNFNPHWFIGAGGNAHLVYELGLTNALPELATVSTVEVLDATSGVPLAHLNGSDLLAAMSLAATPGTLSVELPAASVGIVWLDVLLTIRRAIPGAITHRLAIDPLPEPPLAEAWLFFTTAPMVVDPRLPTFLGAPLAGPVWPRLAVAAMGRNVGRSTRLAVGGNWRSISLSTSTNWRNRIGQGLEIRYCQQVFPP